MLKIKKNREFFLSKNKYRQALHALDKAIALEPENDMFYFSRSKIKKEMQDYKNAVTDIDYALKLQPQITLYKELKDILTPLVK